MRCLTIWTAAGTVAWRTTMVAFLGSGLCLAQLEESGKRSDFQQGKRPLSEVAQWFETGPIVELRFELEAANHKRLKSSPRRYVKARMREGRGEAVEVGVKLKGSAGSFRSLSDKPGLTIDVNRYQRDGAFHGLTKFHLNNAVQDPSYLREDLAYELFRRAGLPAPRVTHARVWLGERDLGLYVLKEGYDTRFLKQRFPGKLGNLYDGGVNGEVDDELDRDVGKGDPDYEDLRALAEACELQPGPKRMAALRKTVDIDQFLTFMAAEVMIGHWDGYTLNPNNYRLYFTGDTRRAVFLVHGTDQTFQKSHAELFPDARGRVAKRVLDEPEWRSAYEQRVRELLPLFAPSDSLIQRVRKRAVRLHAVVKDTMPPTFLHRLVAEQRELERVLTERAEFLSKAVHVGWPKPLTLPADGAALAKLPWRTQSDCRDVRMLGNDGKLETPFTIGAAHCGRCIGSWRTTVLLQPGHYEFRAVMTTKDVAKADDYNPGAGIRISGGRRDWVAEGSEQDRSVSFAFEVEHERQEVVLVLELRASKGSVSFAKDSLQLVPIE